MAQISCKMCSGQNEVSGQSRIICEHCGCEITIPKVNEEKVAWAYNRGNHYRTIGNYDAAYSAYQHIIMENKEEAEAYWCLVLCRYGIDYEKDERTGRYIPTCSRLGKINILEDTDYHMALKFADEESREVYTREAEKIAVIQKRFMEISNTEEPYDVFICYKDKDEKRQRTPASVEAQKLFYRLEDAGVRTFFARITLEDKIGEEYEPYIYAALNSARVMILIADSTEHLEAKWVRNEWNRFLSMRDVDTTKKLIPLCIGMEIGELPDELKTCQAYEYKNIGVVETTLSNVLESIGRQVERVEYVAPTPAPTAEKTPAASIMRAKQLVEDGETDKATELLRKLVRTNPEADEAHLLIMLWKFEAKSLDEIARKGLDHMLIESADFKYAIENASYELRKELEIVSDRYNMYKSGRELFDGNDFVRAKACFERCADYRDAKNYIQKCDEKIKTFEKEEKTRKAKAASDARRAEYEKALDNVLDRVSRKYPEQYGAWKEAEKKLAGKRKISSLHWLGILMNIPILILGAFGSYVSTAVGFPRCWGMLKGRTPELFAWVQDFFASYSFIGSILVTILFFTLWSVGAIMRMAFLTPEKINAASVTVYKPGDIPSIVGLAAFSALCGVVICWLGLGGILIYLMNLLTGIICGIDLVRIAITTVPGTGWRACAKEYVAHDRVIVKLCEQEEALIDKEFSDVADK